MVWTPRTVLRFSATCARLAVLSAFAPRFDVDLSGLAPINGSVANFLGEHATPMDMMGSIPPANRIAEPDTFRLSSATGLSESCA
jgi:hypothetical protein